METEEIPTVKNTVKLCKETTFENIVATDIIDPENGMYLKVALK